MNKWMIGLMIVSILLVGIVGAIIYEEATDEEITDEEFDTLLENYTEDVHDWTQEDEDLLNQSAEDLLNEQIADQTEVNYEEFIDETDELIGELEAELEPTIEEIRGGKYG